MLLRRKAIRRTTRTRSRNRRSMRHGNSLFRLNRKMLRLWLLKLVIRSQAYRNNRGSNRKLR